MMRIFQKEEKTIKGVFAGFYSFEFDDVAITWLPALVVETGEIVALPSHYEIMEAFKMNIDDLIEGKTEVTVIHSGGITLKNARVLENYLVTFDGRACLGHEKMDVATFRQRLIAQRQSLA